MTDIDLELKRLIREVVAGPERPTSSATDAIYYLMQKKAAALRGEGTTGDQVFNTSHAYLWTRHLDTWDWLFKK